MNTMETSELSALHTATPVSESHNEATSSAATESEPKKSSEITQWQRLLQRIRAALVRSERVAEKALHTKRKFMGPSLTRRNFLKTAGLTTIRAGLSSILLNTSVAKGESSPQQQSKDEATK